MRWRIYYGDESIYESENPWDAPGSNVQMIANADPNHGWALEMGRDYYWYEEEVDQWFNGDLFGLYDYLLRPGRKKVLFGRTLGEEQYKKILKRALNDQTLPQKTGWNPGEKLIK